MEILFRTETAYGEGGHKPSEILAYETFGPEMTNTWILEDLCIKLRRYNPLHPIVLELEKLTRKIDNDEADEFFEDYKKAVPFFDKVIKAFEDVTGHKIEHLLWLTTYDIVVDENMYGHSIEDDIADVDAYSVDDAIEVLIEVPCDGNLYAFSKKPEPLNKKFVVEAQKKYKQRDA